MTHDTLEVKHPEAEAVPRGDWAVARRHAGEAVAMGRAAAQHAICCGIELLRLRADVPDQRGTYSRDPIKSDCKTFDFAALAAEELALSRDTVFRWMSAARRQLPRLADVMVGDGCGGVSAEAVVLDGEGTEPGALEAAVADVTEGKTLEQLLLPLDENGRLDPEGLGDRKRERYEALVDAAGRGDEKAAALVKRIDAGEIDPGRAYAGWKGSASAKEKGRTGRAQEDRPALVMKALITLLRQMPYYESFRPATKNRIQEQWAGLMKILPEDLTEGMPRRKR